MPFIPQSWHAGRLADSTRTNCRILSIRDVLVALASSMLTLAVVMYSNGHPRRPHPMHSAAASTSPSMDSVAASTLPSMDSAKLPVGGVSSLLKDLGCGVKNTDGVPHFVNIPGFGLKRSMVDIGLFNGEDTVMFVKAGFRVYAFEPVRRHMQMVRATFMRAGLVEGIDYQSVSLDRSGRITTPLLPPRPGRGIGYLFNAAAGRAHSFRNITHDGVGSSFVDPHNRVSRDVERVQIVPVADYVHEDVYYFKCDTQGFDKEALTGALPLFRSHHVRVVVVEIYPKGLEGAGSSESELLDLLTEQLRLVCFSSMLGSQAPRHMPAGHPESRDAYLGQIREYRKALRDNRWGFFDDLTCIDPRMTAGRAGFAGTARGTGDHG